MATKNYEDWPVKVVGLASLMLDPENPRLRNPSPDNEQRTICRELIEHDNVEKLARDIAQQGYYPTETMVVIKKGRSKFIVLEGNRRTAALKLLTNPQFAPNEKKSRFEALRQEGVGRVPDTVRVVVAPSRTASRPIVLSRHTKTSIAKWSPISQARYIETMVEEGFPDDMIARDMGLQFGEFQRRFRDAKLYLLAASMNLTPDVRDIVEDHRKFKSSTLQRIVETSEARRWLGLEPDDKHGWVIKTDTAGFRTAFSKIVNDVATGKVDSRNLRTTEEVKTYLKTLRGSKPATRRGKPAAASTVAKKPTKGATKKAPIQPPRVTTTPPKSLLPNDVSCDLDVPRVHSIIKELKSLSSHKCPNASAMLYRGLVDMLAAEYLDATERTRDLRKKVDKRKQKPAQWMPSLDQMLRFLVKDIDPSELKVPASARRALAKFVDDKTSSISLEGLNGFAHNRFEDPSQEQLDSIANRLRPLLVVLLQKQIPPN